jgi:hypothetical protein
MDFQWLRCKNFKYLKIGMIASIMSLIDVNVFSKISPLIFDLYSLCEPK